MSEIIDISGLTTIVDKYKSQDKKIVLVHGCFDPFHQGHFELLHYAKKLGVVFLGIDSDKSIKKIKGNTRPLNTLEQRIMVIKKKRLADIIFVLEPKGTYSGYFRKLYKSLSPDFLVTADGEHLLKRKRDLMGLGTKLIVMKKKIFLVKPFA